jgi:hypothetical protein
MRLLRVFEERRGPPLIRPAQGLVGNLLDTATKLRVRRLAV